MAEGSSSPPISHLTTPTPSRGFEARYHPAYLHGPDDESALGIRRIGSYPVFHGGHSDVFKAELKERDGTTLLIALKVLRLTVSDDRLRKREARELIWASLNHDNVAPLYLTYHQSNGSPVFVSQWYENGTANVYLGQHPGVNPMKIILEIASGVEYLHENRIVHGDLKGTNVMIDDGGHARLIDFGLSRFKDCDSGMTTSTRGTIRWCAPELLSSDDTRPTTSSDVYGFASTVLELLTGNVPYATLSTWVVYKIIYFQGTGPRGSSDPLRYTVYNSTFLWNVLERCWAAMHLRPNINEVKHQLCVVCNVETMCRQG